MLQISPDKACFVVVKARAFDAKVDPVNPDPGSNPSDDGMREVLEDYADDSTYDELKTFIDDLNTDEQIDLVALAWIGRGSFGVEDWAEARAEAARAHNEHTAGYLLGMPRLGDYIEEGLVALDYTCAEVEVRHL